MSQVPEQQYQTWGNTGGGAASNLFRTFSCCGIPAPPPAPQLCLHPPHLQSAAATRGGRSPGSDRPKVLRFPAVCHQVRRAGAEGHPSALCSAGERDFPGDGGQGGDVCCWTQGRPACPGGVTDKAEKKTAGCTQSDGYSAEPAWHSPSAAILGGPSPANSFIHSFIRSPVHSSIQHQHVLTAGDGRSRGETAWSLPVWGASPQERGKLKPLSPHSWGGGLGPGAAWDLQPGLPGSRPYSVCISIPSSVAASDVCPVPLIAALRPVQGTSGHLLCIPVPVGKLVSSRLPWHLVPVTGQV